MGRWAVLALRAVLVASMLGTLIVQLVMAPLLWIDFDEAEPAVQDLRVPVVTIFVLGILTIQVTMVCIWRLLTLVRKGTVFSHQSFRYVDVIIGAAVAASLLAFALALVLAPGETVAPGIVGLICGASLMIGGVALLVLVLRSLLAQAVALDAETRQLQAELDEVI